MEGREHTSWDFVKAIALPIDIKSPRLLCVANDDVIMLGDSLRGLVFEVNIATEQLTKKPLQGDVMDCAITADGMSFYASESPSGCIGVYDKNGKRVREIRVGGITSPCTLVIDVDKEGLIVAGNLCRNCNEVQFVNPSTGSIIRSTVLSDGEQIRGEIRMTSSGLVVVKAYDDGFVVLDGGTAKVRSRLKRKEWIEARCTGDPVTGNLYVCYLENSKESPGIAVIDEVEVDGRSKNKESITFKQLSRPLIAPLITAQGQMVVCNGKDLLIYKKAFMYNVTTKPQRKWVKV